MFSIIVSVCELLIMYLEPIYHTGTCLFNSAIPHVLINIYPAMTLAIILSCNVIYTSTFIQQWLLPYNVFYGHLVVNKYKPVCCIINKYMKTNITLSSNAPCHSSWAILWNLVVYKYKLWAVLWTKSTRNMTVMGYACTIQSWGSVVILGSTRYIHPPIYYMLFP